MNKKFLLIALTVFAVTNVSVFASDKDNKKDEVKVAALPKHAEDILKECSEKIKETTSEIEKLNKAIEDVKNQKKEALDDNKDADVKDFDTQIAKMEKEKVEETTILNDLVALEKDAKNQFDLAYNKSFMNKVTAPMTKFAQWVASNRKVALALEITGVAGVSYVIYKSFFAQEEDDEDTL